MSDPVAAATLDDSQKAVTLSESAEMMDAMIAKASTPNLASLFRAGKKAGLIKPQYQYQHSG